MSSPNGGLSVIVPTLAASRAQAVVDSLAAQTTAHQAILVDNGSPDPRRMEGLRARHPSLEIVRLESNHGYSRAVNIAAGRADGEVLVLINDDCRLEPRFLEELVRPLDPGRGVVMAAGVLWDAWTPTLIDTAGVAVDATLMAFDYLTGQTRAALDTAAPPLGPSAGAAAIERQAFLDVGGFDETLFAYLEDVDLALRLRLIGGRCALAPGAVGTHEHSATLGSGSASKDYLMGYGRGYLLRKWSVMNLRRLPGVVLRDGVICLGQAIVDRNLAGIRGRVRGYAAAGARHPYPAHVLASEAHGGGLTTLSRQARRRWRLRRRVDPALAKSLAE